MHFPRKCAGSIPSCAEQHCRIFGRVTSRPGESSTEPSDEAADPINRSRIIRLLLIGQEPTEIEVELVEDSVSLLTEETTYIEIAVLIKDEKTAKQAGPMFTFDKTLDMDLVQANWNLENMNEFSHLFSC